MPVKISLARTPDTTDAVFKLRHKVFVEQEQAMPTHPSGRLIDRYDAFPTTENLVAICEGEVIGALRLTLPNSLEDPTQRWYDFAQHVPDGANVMGCGMYVVDKPYRGLRVTFNMILMASYYGVSKGITHVVAPMNPEVAPLAKQIGFELLSDPIVDSVTGLTIIPVMLDARNLNDYFARFAEDNSLYNFLGSYECIAYTRGECVVRRGDRGDAAFVIIAGEVEIRQPDSDEVLATMGKGEVFGELALLTDATRSANVYASTDLRVMTLSRAAFIEHLHQNPAHAVELLSSIGARMKAMLDRPFIYL